MGLSVIIITKNEAKDLPRALASVSFADEVILLDSGSTDGTQKIANDWGAKVFETDDWPGFGPQKNRALDKVSQDWVLSLDADEWVEPNLASEIERVIRLDATCPTPETSAFRFRRHSIFIDRVIRYGDWRRDKVVRLFRRNRARFSDDLVHERLIVDGTINDLQGSLGHHSVRYLSESIEKMWQYNRVSAEKIARQGRGGRLKGFVKAIFSLVRGLIFRAGVLDGKRGIQLAWFNARGTYLRYALAQCTQDKQAYRAGTQSPLQRLQDLFHLFVVDHGFLRSIYANQFRLAGGLYRVNQPSPRRLAHYKGKYGIRTVINLRGKNEQLGWYRLERGACKRLGLEMVDIQIYSRGLLDKKRLLELKKLIESLRLPAVVHCKSGADRAGFFSVLYRHYRLGEPIEQAVQELGLKYGHSATAKTGVLDLFFKTYITKRRIRQTLDDWIWSQYDDQAIQSSFKPTPLAAWVIDWFMRRE